MRSLRWGSRGRGLAAAGFLGLAALGCGDDDGRGGDAGDYGASCGDIIAVCHDVDTGTGRIAECHDIAHEEVEAACAPILDECVALCEATAAGGGTHEHDVDGGAHAH